MITPGLLRRAAWRSLQWRLLLASLAVLLLPVLPLFLTLRAFLGELLDHSPRAAELTRHLDSPVLVDLLRHSAQPDFSGVQQGLLAGLLLAVFLLPLLPALALTAAQGDEPLALRELLGGAAGLYPRLLRTGLLGLLVLGLAGGLSAPLFAWADKVAHHATSEQQAGQAQRVAQGAALLLVLLGQLINDAARAAFAAEPSRRSALFALGAGVRLVVRRARHCVPLLLVTALPSLGAAAAVMLLRNQLVQAGPATVGLGFLLGQLASALLVYGHAVRLLGLAELHRADAAERAARHTEPPRPAPAPLPALVLAPVTDAPPAPAPTPEEPAVAPAAAPASPGAPSAAD